jgi:ankyrin repeat protein
MTSTSATRCSASRSLPEAIYRESIGESALHLAIVHDDYQTVQLLLQNSADVGARACGEFFMPEDHMKKTSSYRGLPTFLAFFTRQYMFLSGLCAFFCSPSNDF